MSRKHAGFFSTVLPKCQELQESCSVVTATERLGDTLGEEEKPQGQLPVPPVPSMPAHSAQPQGWGPHWANPAPCSNGNTQRPSQNLQAGLSEGNQAVAECRADAHRYRSWHLPDTWLDWGRGGSGLAAAASSGLGTGSQGPFPAAAASWEEAGAPCCSKGLPGLPGGPGGSLEVTAGRAHRIAPGQPEDKPLHLEPWEMPARLSLPCPELPVGLGAFP